MKKFYALLSAFVILSCVVCNAQTSEVNRTNHWYFGEGIGLDFSSGTPELDTSSPISQREAGAVMSDMEGNLLFYTDGDTVWNRYHQMMPNGFGVGCESSTNGAVIVPNPGHDNLYYLFTVDCWENFGSHGLRYSVIDVTANNDSGVILQKNVQLYSPSSEQLAVTRHCNGIDYWVVSHEYSANKFYAYLITPTGIDTTPVISYHGGDTLPVSKAIGNSGSMCFSANGEKLCFVSSWLGAKLFDFNLTTGNIDNMIVLSETRYEYGCAFSPDNSKLYVSLTFTPGYGIHISQYDLSSGDSANIIASKNLIMFISQFSGFLNYNIAGLECSKNGTITVARYYNDSIGIITNPNTYGVACDYQTFPISFNGKLCKEQFPNINTNYYNPNLYICSNGIPETGNASIKYFPNPVTDKLTITNLMGEYDAIAIYSIDGRYVLFRQLEFANEAEVDIDQLSSGIYILSLSQSRDAKIKSIKFIKANN